MIVFAYQDYFLVFINHSATSALQLLAGVRVGMLKSKGCEFNSWSGVTIKQLLLGWDS